MVAAALGRLIRLSDTPAVDALFCVALTRALEPEELEKQRIRRHIFLARYGRQSMLQWRDVDGREVRVYAEALADFLREEAEAVKKATAEAAAK